MLAQKEEIVCIVGFHCRGTILTEVLLKLSQKNGKVSWSKEARKQLVPISKGLKKHLCLERREESKRVRLQTVGQHLCSSWIDQN